MATKALVYIATSLDGFIARKGGELDWLDEANASVPDGGDCGFQAFFDSVDALVMGRKTYEKVLSIEKWPYGAKRVFVLSSRSIEFPASIPGSVSCSSESPSAICDRLSGEGMNRLYIDGGATIQRFVAEGLIDEITITVIPVLLGDGIPLFGSMEKSTPLTHISTRVFEFGFVQSTYAIANED